MKELSVGRLRLFLAALAGLVAASCNAEVLTTIDVNANGSGAVEVALMMDPELAAQLPDLESAGIALADARASGWVIEPRELTDDGRTRIQARKEFANPDQFAIVINEIAGPEGVFSDFALDRTSSFAQVSFAVTGRIVPSGLTTFSDPELDALLGEPLADFAARLGADPSATTVQLAVTLPGEVPPDGSNGLRFDQASDSTTRFWRTTLADPNPTIVSTESSTREIAALVALGVAVLTGVMALLIALAIGMRVVQARQKPAPTVGKRPSARAPRRDKVPDLDLGARAPSAPVSKNPTVVALDGMGVLYGRGADVDEVLVPFCFEKGSTLTADEIAGRARQLSLGRIDPPTFWRAVGVTGDPDALDDEYLAKHALKPGVVKFLRSLRDKNVRIACITNDSAHWARKLRQRHSLDALIDPWVISGAVGVRKPDRSIFEVLRRLTGEVPANILVVDDQVHILDAARALGYRTAWFAPDGSAEDANGHSILRSFEVPEPAGAARS